FFLLAQANDAPPQGFSPLLTMVLPIGVLFYFLVLRPQRQRDQARRRLLANLKKNDRVVTVGGIYGIVSNVHREADQVTIKVDESTNTQLRVTISAIERVISEEDSSADTAGKS